MMMMMMTMTSAATGKELLININSPEGVTDDDRPPVGQ